MFPRQYKGEDCSVCIQVDPINCSRIHDGEAQPPTTSNNDLEEIFNDLWRTINNSPGSNYLFGDDNEEAFEEAKTQVQQMLDKARIDENIKKKEFYLESKRQLVEAAQEVGHDSSYVIQSVDLVLKEIDDRIKTLKGEL